MKRTSSIIVGMLFFVAADAQNIVVHKSNGSVEKYASSKVEYIDFTAGVQGVDLGLPSGVKWANVNVGATSPEDFGDYFAWGETESKSEYSWRTYKWCNGSYKTLKKYCISSEFGTVDNKKVLDPEDDVAHVKWGGSWRMPTYEEMAELKANCIWELTKVNGVSGYKVTGPNGKSIFLPAAGYRYDSKLNQVDVNSDYWTASLNTGNSYRTWDFYFNSNSYEISGDNRYYGHSVRPVTK